MSETRTKRRTVPDHARVLLAAVKTVTEGAPLEASAEDLDAAKRWLEAKLQPGGAWPKGGGKRWKR